MRHASLVSPFRALVIPGAFAAIACASAIACSDGDARSCRVGADCASGMCGADGVCVSGPAATPGSSGSSGTPDAGTGADVTLPPDDGGNLAVPGCVPNKDGTILRDEVPIKAGLRATFRVAENVDISTAGEPTANGRRKWDLSTALPNESNVLVETVALTDKWFAASFQNATYGTSLRKSSDLIGIFESGPGSLSLRGVASPDDGLFKTKLTNDPPVSVLEFPLTLGKKWSTRTSVSGYAQGYISSYTEKYDSEVDAAGELVTPLGTFDVLRVRLVLTRTVGFLVTTIRTYAFITECFGNVASIASEDDETDVEFTRAVEVRRIAP